MRNLAQFLIALIALLISNVVEAATPGLWALRFKSTGTVTTHHSEMGAGVNVRFTSAYRVLICSSIWSERTTQP
jgi:hypothetical protein